MTLTEAKTIADRPDGCTVEQLRAAEVRLAYASKFAHHSEKAWDKAERRLERLRSEIAKFRTNGE